MCVRIKGVIQADVPCSVWIHDESVTVSRMYSFGID